MTAGVNGKPWDFEDMAALTEKQVPAKRGPYRKRAA
jgi:hypothetical protein